MFELGIAIVAFIFGFASGAFWHAIDVVRLEILNQMLWVKQNLGREYAAPMERELIKLANKLKREAVADYEAEQALKRGKK